jgi:ferredoxin
LKKQKKDIRPFSVHPEKCTRCYLCQMFCSLKYQGEVNPAKSFTQIIGRDKAEKIKMTRGCTVCGDCVTVCYYGARVFKEEKIEK